MHQADGKCSNLNHRHAAGLFLCLQSNEGDLLQAL